MSARAIQISITAGALLIAIAHLIWPDLKIDAITLTLIMIAIIPWLAPLFKSVELPGGWKFEFQELLKAQERAGKAGLLAESEDGPEYSFQLVADEDANLALAGLRIEIESRLVKLAESADVDIRRSSVGRLMRLLSQREILTNEERSILEDLIGTLNAAVHGADVDSRAADWAMEIGPRLLKALDNKIQQ
ncbi:hypothetical protein [Halalkalibaculum sp. DA384]|uniref:hypothetical protein n=1 Tax=Halalkalibaculum sp. DA384 TaxID=3373606 RepID=UPI0037543EA5